MKTQNDSLQSLLTTLNLGPVPDSSSFAIATCPVPGSRLSALDPVPSSRLPALAPNPAPGSSLPAAAPASSSPLPAPSSPLLKGRPRTGAVASLPKEVRDMVCRMLTGHIPYKRIVEACDNLGYELTERNVSNWVTHGGYAEWSALYDDALQTTLRQDDLLEHHRDENSADLAEVGLQAAAVRISELLLRQMASCQDVEANFSKLEPVVNLLCRINKELFTLQKYRDDCLTKIYRTPCKTKAKDLDKLDLVEMVYSADPKPKQADTNSQSAMPQPTAPQSTPEPHPANCQSTIGQLTIPETASLPATDASDASADTIPVLAESIAEQPTVPSPSIGQLPICQSPISEPAPTQSFPEPTNCQTTIPESLDPQSAAATPSTHQSTIPQPEATSTVDSTEASNPSNSGNLQ